MSGELSGESWRSVRGTVTPRLEPYVVPADQPVHAAYAEPDGWRYPAKHFDNAEHALAYASAVTWLAGPDAAARRVWHVSACDCGVDR